MSATLEPAVPTTPAPVDPIPVAEAVADMRQTMGAVKVSFSWLGTRRSLNDNQTRQAADQFDADASLLTAYKKLIDTSHPAFKAVSAIKSQVVSYWRGVTLPYPTDGVRLIKYDDITEFEARMQEFRTRLTEAVAQLQLEYEVLKTRAREHLGTLYNAADYPTTLAGAFSISWEYPSVEPPRYLRTFNPELYAQEQQRIQHRFEQAIEMAESAFGEKLQELINHLIERLTDAPDGAPKKFQTSTVENFREFYQEFRHLNIRGNTELDALVGRANDLISGIEANDLRKSQNLREALREQMGELQTALDGHLQTAPRRRLQRLDD
jgi:hypothetical protein